MTSPRSVSSLLAQIVTSLVVSLTMILLLAACPPTAPGPVGPPPAPGQPPAAQPPQPPPGSAECSPHDCGPTMAMPNGKCDDGTMSGPTGRCLRQADGRCGWEVRQCPPAATACVRTGCSGTICAEAGNDVMTTCEMRPEYECYRSATCERQRTGACGWTPTAALTQCLTAAGHK